MLRWPIRRERIERRCDTIYTDKIARPEDRMTANTAPPATIITRPLTADEIGKGRQV